jgi:single-stranded-DNA-specific exonuclease
MSTTYADELLDLVALGLIADMMSLQDLETRHLVSLGLENITNPFFATMVEKNAFSIGDEITPMGIAFYVAPYVNATVRMGTQEEKELLFKSMLEYEADELIPSTKRGHKGEMETVVEQACRNCTNIKNRQTKARDSALETIEKLIEEKQLLNNKILVVQLNSSYSVDRNLTGLIANQLMAKYQRPVLLLNEVNSDSGKTWEGSARGYDKSELKNFRGFLEMFCPVMYAEGHASAFGTGITDADFNSFIEISNHCLKDIEFTPSYNVDFIFNGGEFQADDIIEIANLKHLWGQGVEEPYVAIENIKIANENIRLMSPDKNPTLKITLPNGTSLIKFKSSQEEYEKLHSATGCITINVVGRCERNDWNGMTYPQIIMEDYEITKVIPYYF